VRALAFHCLEEILHALPNRRDRLGDNAFDVSMPAKIDAMPADFVPSLSRIPARLSSGLFFQGSSLRRRSRSEISHSVAELAEQDTGLIERLFQLLHAAERTVKRPVSAARPRSRDRSARASVR
jgi:hypothetical protein